MVPPVVSLLAKNAGIIILVKPQFEARRNQIEPGGVVLNPTVHDEVIDGVVSGSCSIQKE